MSNLQIIEKLCRMLDEAQEIIRKQEEMLEIHGIVSDTGALEKERESLLEEIEKSI